MNARQALGALLGVLGRPDGWAQAGIAQAIEEAWAAYRSADSALWVVCKNDYPEAWAATEEEADAVCREQTALEVKREQAGGQGLRLYWHAHKVSRTR